MMLMLVLCFVCVWLRAPGLQVHNLFSQYGQIEEVFMLSKKGRSGQGCCFVRYISVDAAAAAVAATDGKVTLR